MLYNWISITFQLRLGRMTGFLLLLIFISGAYRANGAGKGIVFSVYFCTASLMLRTRFFLHKLKLKIESFRLDNYNKKLESEAGKSLMISNICITMVTMTGVQPLLFYCLNLSEIIIISMLVIRLYYWCVGRHNKLILSKQLAPAPAQKTRALQFGVYTRCPILDNFLHYWS